MFNIRVKVLVGYCILAVVILSVTWMVYDNTRSLAAINYASAKMMTRRDIVDSLVYSMLETANAERSILLGNTDEWQRFDTALDSSKDKAKRLRPLISDSLKKQRLDTLMTLLETRRKNILLVMDEQQKDMADIYYKDKMHALKSGRDSVVIHSKSEEKHVQYETVYEIVKTKRGFFRRLGDAFRRQHSDTIDATHIVIPPSADTIDHKIDIADSVANVLSEIRHEGKQAKNRQQNAIAIRNRQLQKICLQLAQRTGQLLEDIQTDEHIALQQAILSTIGSRQMMMVRIFVLGLFAIILSAILVWRIFKDSRREQRDHNRIVEAKAETERIMQQRERLLLTITHDIKAPAASIAGFVGLLGEYISQPKPIEYLKNIEGTAKHMLQLVTALLDYHQLESGKTELQAVSFSPYAILQECVCQMQPQAMAKRLSLTTDIKMPSDIVCRADAFRIKQIVNNLVSNAIKYTDVGNVVVGGFICDSRLVISVADTGCGMSDDEKQRVFNAFTRLPNAQGKDGVGLGLSITRELVDLFGGTVDVVSHKGKGSEFTVAVPVEITQAEILGDCSQTPVQSAKTLSQDNNLQKCSEITVLIVDDDNLQLQLITEMLSHIEGAHFKIVSTLHAIEAISIAHDMAPHIVLTDIEMPEMNGRDILKHILDDTEISDGMKFIAMTAHEPSIMEQIRKEGFDACLFKPFDTNTLAATVCQLTGLRLKVVESKETASGLYSVIDHFADGDADARRQIIHDICTAMKEYLSLLHDADNLEHVARAAHKAMPLLEMLQPGCCDWLSKLTPEHIAATDISDRSVLVERLKTVLEEKLRQLNDSSE